MSQYKYINSFSEGVGKVLAIILGLLIGYFVNWIAGFGLASLFILKELFQFCRSPNGIPLNICKHVNYHEDKIKFSQRFLAGFLCIIAVVVLTGVMELVLSLFDEQTFELKFLTTIISVFPLTCLPYVLNKNYWFFPVSGVAFIIFYAGLMS